LDQIRLCLEHRAVERAELQRMCSELRIHGDFDVATTKDVVAEQFERGLLPAS